MRRLSTSAVVLLTFPPVFALSIVAGRATRLGGSEVALVWPAAAVAVMWLLAVHPCSLRQRAIHVTLLGILAYGVNVATGATVSLSAWFVLVNVVLAVVTVGLLHYGRSDAVLRDPADLARLVVAVATGTMCAAVLATLYLTPVTGAPAWETFALFTARNGASALVGVAVWLCLRDVPWKRPRVRPAMLVEGLIVGTIVVSVFAWSFWLNTGTPMTFVVLLPTTWVALRYSTPVSTLFVVAAANWIIFATLSDRGPLLASDLQVRALLAQGMVFSLTVIVLALALYRDSRVRLIAELEASRDQADQDSELLGAVLDSIHDGVILVDPADRVVLRNARADDSGLVDEVVAAARTAGHGGADAPEPAVPHDVIVSVEDSRTLELTTTPLPRQPQFDVMAFRDVTEVRRNARELREARDLFAGVLQAASEQAIIGTDQNGLITVFNQGAERLLGWTAEEMIGRPVTDVHDLAEMIVRADELGVPPGFEAFIANVTPDDAEIREWTYVRRDGSHAEVSLAISQMSDADGCCVGYIGVATDITERKKAERALAESEERFRSAFDTAPMGMFMFTVTPGDAGRITRCNQALADFLGRSTSEVPGMSVTDLGTNENADGTEGLARLLALTDGEPVSAEVRFRRWDGDTMWGAVSASVVAAAGADPYGICLVEDITSRKRAEAELQHLALHDPLTGLANRALLVDRVEQAIADIGRHAPACVGLLYLDLDGFKPVNDTWGHAAGDEVLIAVARRIENSIRPGDTAARLGGDEFAVLCPVIKDSEALHGIAERIRREVRRPLRLRAGRTYDRLSASIGAATSGGNSNAESLIAHTDRLMYRAKRNGKDRVADDLVPVEG